MYINKGVEAYKIILDSEYGSISKELTFREPNMGNEQSPYFE